MTHIYIFFKKESAIYICIYIEVDNVFLKIFGLLRTKYYIKKIRLILQRSACVRVFKSRVNVSQMNPKDKKNKPFFFFFEIVSTYSVRS